MSMRGRAGAPALVNVLRACLHGSTQNGLYPSCPPASANDWMLAMSPPLKLTCAPPSAVQAIAFTVSRGRYW